MLVMRKSYTMKEVAAEIKEKRPDILEVMAEDVEKRN
jgi:hypothetical protein